jgi:hypothetical protein
MLSAEPVCSCAHFFVHIAHETAGAARTRSSLRPLYFEGGRFFNGSGAWRRENAESYLAPSLRATGSRECAPDDRLREAIHLAAQRKNGLLRCARNDVDKSMPPPAVIARLDRAILVALSRLRQGFAEASVHWRAEAFAEAASRATTAGKPFDD